MLLVTYFGRDILETRSIFGTVNNALKRKIAHEKISHTGE
ncbi:hypothetical protein ADIS_3748 [Lunatimonas lonarensis]|uniref:Uncharacterized protein n=1 Tax=Lunatimonas lonarensis TaxID=1232681 RepID=R7ZP46_9BACT|nr:hypothetical protein ADIS_3748 [Lunatimonas lonarensis]